MFLLSQLTHFVCVISQEKKWMIAGGISELKETGKMYLPVKTNKKQLMRDDNS